MVARFVDFNAAKEGVQVGNKIVNTLIGPRGGAKYINSKGNERYISSAKQVIFYSVPIEIK